MEHYRSTLATTAVAVFGLVAAAHILHPGNYEAQPRPVRAPMAVAADATAWVDPPAELRAAGAPPNRAADVPAPSDVPVLSDVPGLLAPRMLAVLPPGATMAPPLPSAMASPPGRERKVAATPRRRVAQRAARSRQASLDRGTIAEEPAAQRTDAPEPRVKVDPIGDLIRGLGLGGEG